MHGNRVPSGSDLSLIANAPGANKRKTGATLQSNWAAAVIVAISLLFTAPMWAATHWVDTAAASLPPGTGCGMNAGYNTIQAAVNAASPGDTIRVCAGTYPEVAPGPLTINKTLTLLGAQNGVDARNPRGAESIVSDVQGTSVSASGVVLDGFTFQNSISPVFTGYGIWLNPGISGTKVLNNIVQNNIIGIGLANLNAQAVIRHNLIQNNTVPGPGSGSGIYTDEFSGGPIVRNVLIEENSFIGHAGFGAAINISNTDTAPANGVFNLEVSANLFDMNSRAFVLFNTHMSSIHDNRIANNTFVASAAIRIFDNNTQLQIVNNDLVNGVAHAIRLSAILGVPSSGVVINQNNIGVVGSTSFTLTGLTVDPLSHVGTVDAECNWWGSPSGPTDPINNPSGTGEEVVGDADYTPWLLAPAPGGPCLGGVPSTPGKVTGGGQIPGQDPIFSPLGELLSLPALLPSLSSPDGKATFGFVVRCCPANGNLEYKDHEMDVRIKAQSIDSLVISDGPCGPNTHATFTGMASVIRPTGTTTEFFVVEVDDCGEPGTLDTFSIQAETYSNGPSPLVGGNIQIH